MEEEKGSEMEIKEEIGLLQKSKEFIGWRKKNKSHYLSYALFITGEDNDKLQVGYYDKNKDKVTTFDILCKDKRELIKIEPEENVFKKPEAKVEELKMEEVKIDVNDVLQISDRLQKEKYPGEVPVKIVIILQKLDPYGQIYNVTYVTKCFKTLNMKIDSETGDIVEDDLVSLIQLPSK